MGRPARKDIADQAFNAGYDAAVRNGEHSGCQEARDLLRHLVEVARASPLAAVTVEYLESLRGR